MLHTPHLINEIRSLPPEDGWPCHEQTGRACVVCPCGLNTGFINAREACQQFKGHAQGDYYQGTHTLPRVPGASAYPGLHAHA